MNTCEPNADQPVLKGCGGDFNPRLFKWATPTPEPRVTTSINDMSRYRTKRRYVQSVFDSIIGQLVPHLLCPKGKYCAITSHRGSVYLLPSQSLFPLPLRFQKQIIVGVFPVKLKAYKIDLRPQLNEFHSKFFTVIF